ncbi:hypothetical protein D3C85_1235660 [compost metagenome]
MFKVEQRGRLGVFRAQRNAERQSDASQGGMDTALEYANPEDQANQHVGAELHHAESVHRDQCRDTGCGQRQRQGRQRAGIEDRDDDDCAKVVDDRQGHQEQFQRDRNTFTQ